MPSSAGQYDNCQEGKTLVSDKVLVAEIRVHVIPGLLYGDMALALSLFWSLVHKPHAGTFWADWRYGNSVAHLVD